MSTLFAPMASRKALVFATFGALGCLVGWLLGEPFLAMTLSTVQSEQAPSLVSQTPPTPPPEFKSRLDREGAKSGDIQLSLIWDNTNDLDLHCVDPTGFRIFFQRKRAPSGGHLDVDQNADCQRSVINPVENIYWPQGGAPEGKYQVQVHFFKACDPRNISTAFSVSWLVGGVRTTEKFRAERVNEFIDITEFVVKPILLIEPSLQKMSFRSGETLPLRVDVQRRFCKGPVTLQIDHPQLTAPEVRVSATESFGVLNITAKSRVDGTKPLQISGLLGDIRGQATVQVSSPPWWSWWTIFVTAVWTSLLAGGLAAALVARQNRYLNRPLLADPKLIPIVLGCAVAGLLSGGGGQVLQFGFALVNLPVVLGYLAGWVVLGGLVGRGVGFFIPNLAGTKALLAGSVGGALGVLGFFLGLLFADPLGRFLGAAILGGCIGLMVVLVEVGFRQAWLVVEFPGNERISVNLGPEPVKIGSDSRSCTVYARGAESVAVRYFLRNGQIICHELATNQERVVYAGDQKQVGNTLLTVQTGQRESTNTSPTVPLASRPVPPPVVPAVPPMPVVATPPATTLPKAPALTREATPPVPANPEKSGCPSCGRSAPGSPGTRYCMICERTF